MTTPARPLCARRSLPARSPAWRRRRATLPPWPAWFVLPRQPCPPTAARGSHAGSRLLSSPPRSSRSSLSRRSPRLSVPRRLRRTRRRTPAAMPRDDRSTPIGLVEARPRIRPPRHRGALRRPVSHVGASVRTAVAPRNPGTRGARKRACSATQCRTGAMSATGDSRRVPPPSRRGSPGCPASEWVTLACRSDGAPRAGSSRFADRRC